MPNREMLLVPGPTPVVDEIYEALSEETMSHTDMRFAAIFKEALEMTKRMYNTDGEVFVIAGSGTLSMEMALVNTIAPGERVLIISHGYFGDRFIGLAESLGIEADVLQSEWGKQVSLSDIEDKLKVGGYKAVTVTHVDTSTGVKSNLDDLVPLVKKNGALFILDGVCASAAMEEDMGREYGHPDYKIDIAFTASQKAIGVPPGLAIVAFGPKALKAREELGRITAYYADINNWRHIMREPNKYFATHPINMIYAYNKAMNMIMEEGIEARYNRHTALGKAIRTAIKVYGMQILADEAAAAPTLSCILYPDGIDDAKFRSALAGKGLIVAGALGNLLGKGFRLGHMGNTSNDSFIKALRIIAQTLKEQGHEVDGIEAEKIFMDTFNTEYAK